MLCKMSIKLKIYLQLIPSKDHLFDGHLFILTLHIWVQGFTVALTYSNKIYLYCVPGISLNVLLPLIFIITLWVLIIISIIDEKTKT